VDSKAEYSASSSTLSQKKYIKKKLKQTNASAPLNSVQVKIREDSQEGIRVIIE